jgi:endonuclease III
VGVKLLFTPTYWALVLPSVFFICASASCTFGLVRMARGQEDAPPLVVAPKLSEQSQDEQIDKVVEQLRRVYEFCKQQACTVIPRAQYEAIQRDMEELRRDLYEIEKPRPSQAGCA